MAQIILKIVYFNSLGEKDEPLKAALSMGAAVKRKEERFERLFRRTEELLYKIKKKGGSSFLIEEQRLLDNPSGPLIHIVQQGGKMAPYHVWTWTWPGH